ncbi:hypothetical protein Celly_0944 [Cellulophaga lytica DSM 7489]|uniref:Uncharacterized protein n=1 Tax=Cellulophaga lytica (strain ATCC 23178 / DSM 7489 / JCM 8516 / NBRC 14961 / NCIMB 1423 / VKM B-1433 / Cy l20) TaxID=867900 RepID=F0RDM7_CELLC|nr:hypothetical protein [Cellulophaga lytica]ADY28775.1 hypothetical protein Celly_0944 [Cellulophaga lytica DSM 7489]WQG77046.1 hypothetical protein SR888_15300 [Cellulophaga lytica]
MKKIFPIILIVLAGIYIYKLEKLNSELMEMTKELTFEKFDNSIHPSNSYIYQNGNQKIEMKISNGKDYLIYDKPTETEFLITNIEPNDITIYGAGIRIIRNSNGILKTEITAPNNYNESDNLSVKISIEKKEKIEFNIPLKNVE